MQVADNSAAASDPVVVPWNQLEDEYTSKLVEALKEYIDVLPVLFHFKRIRDDISKLKQLIYYYARNSRFVRMPTLMGLIETSLDDHRRQLGLPIYQLKRYMCISAGKAAYIEAVLVNVPFESQFLFREAFYDYFRESDAATYAVDVALIYNAELCCYAQRLRNVLTKICGLNVQPANLGSLNAVRQIIVLDKPDDSPILREALNRATTVVLKTRFSRTNHKQREIPFPTHVNFIDTPLLLINGMTTFLIHLLQAQPPVSSPFATEVSDNKNSRRSSI